MNSMKRQKDRTLKDEFTRSVDATGDQSWVFNGRNDAEAETTILWPPEVKN